MDEKTLMVKIPINSNEYYLVENRQEYAYSETLYADMEMGVIVYVDGGQWDYFLPGSGLLIWHIDEQVIDENWATNTVNADASRKGVDLEEADGVQDFDGWVQGSSYEIYGNEYDAFFSPHNDSFAPRTTPSTADNDGGFTGMYVVDVSGSGNSMSARIQRGGDEQFKPRDDFPLSLGDTSGFGTNSVAVWDEDGQSRIVVAGRGGELYVVGNDVTTLSTGDTILSSPLVCGDSVIVVTRDGWWYTWTRDSATVFDLGEGPFYSSPAAGDIDGDGTVEFVVGSDDMWLYFVDNGEVVTKKFLGDVIRTSPAIADLNGDGADEVIVSVGDSRLFVFNGRGDILPGFPVVTEVLGPLCASPVVGDLDADGEFELVALSMDGRVHCYNVSGDPESYWPAVIGQPGSPSPALGDIDRDGYLEVVVLAGGNLYAFNHNGTICTGFPVEIKKVPLYQSPWVSDVIIGGWPADTIVPCSSPVLVDIEGDGYLEILFGSGTNLCAYDYLGNELEGFPLGCGGAVSATPSILVRGDTLRLFAASDEGMLYSWEVTGNRDTRAVWPMFRGDLLHSGSYLGTSPFPPTPAAVLLKDVYNYPNPVHGARTTLRYYLAADATVRVRIFDVAGEVVGEYEGRTTPNEYNEMLLNLDALATGLYIYKIEAKSSTRSEEVIGKLAIVR
ncbi:hypothetical protein AMJ40_07425 [candidate division TA06 bacterium DG_26]|uniref:Secretion system C-terminal sorting domain-containing protein n=1 Tax=candidate division TA06 bacterium DG_26 TaxID=1703771 RepID=A0A0S7WEB5_UNCT6|nr:MAG: hypothetical protein AMJ40_07425 [candidate division TA06 bacterium DG_26]